MRPKPMAPTCLPRIVVAMIYRLFSTVGFECLLFMVYPNTWCHKSKSRATSGTLYTFTLDDLPCHQQAPGLSY